MFRALLKDPYKLFFPFGLFFLIYACGLWICHIFLNYGDFPLRAHASFFIGGYLYFSIIGFLLTAIPRFTSSDFMSKKEFFVFFLVMFMTFIGCLINLRLIFWIAIFIGWLSLFIFGFKRFKKRKQNPPYTFVFIGLGLLMGVLSSGLNILVYIPSLKLDHLSIIGDLLFYDGMVTSFILGVGGRLIPGILGFQEIVKKQRDIYESSVPFLTLVPIDIYLSLLSFAFSFYLEAAISETGAYILRSIVITYFSFKYWGLHKKIENSKWHARMLKISCFFILIAYWLLCFFPEDSITIKHLMYIGSYCLMTFMVASRVVIAHSSESLDIEYKKYPYLLIGGLVILATLTRVSASYMPDSFLSHLGYAAIILLIAGLFWGYFFIKKMRITNL